MADFVTQTRPKYTYFDFKAGKCSDLDYMRSAYGGTVTKHFVLRDTRRKHPFFLIIRELKEGKFKYYEAKVYDFTRGLINKEIIYEKVSNDKYWNGDDDSLGFADSTFFRQYVQFLVDTAEIITEVKRSK